MTHTNHARRLGISRNTWWSITIRSGLACLLLASGWAGADSQHGLLQVDDWSVDAAAARHTGLPILILFSTSQCYYCERLKSEILEPLVNRREMEGLACVRELDIARGGKIRDFDGEKVRTRMFIKRYGIYATPTLLLVDDQGNPIGAPIVGFNNSDEYLPYLQQLLEDNGATPQLAGSRAGPAKTPGSS